MIGWQVWPNQIFFRAWEEVGLQGRRVEVSQSRLITPLSILAVAKNVLLIDSNYSLIYDLSSSTPLPT